ncbi:MAG: aminotransferase class I/II-fold pyridoxal phosphate-dependent enzyme [Rhizobiaceae bacterium]|nr:aminotransferase class I/II-fold pyridoxal phosphate-dependent enzyme [Rhizobiaceae bacterium]
MKMTRNIKPDTIAAQAAGHLDRASGGVVPALQPSTTFARDQNNALLNSDNLYGRDSNDAVRLAEEILTKLENAKDTLLFPSGMAAIAALFRTLQGGATVVLQSGIYWGTIQWIRTFCARRNIKLLEVEASDNALLESACEENYPDIIFVETPSNPWLKTIDIAFASNCAKKSSAILVVDGTAATPILTRALDHGADIVMHSATKAINGHSDVLAGVLVIKDDDLPIWADIKADRHDAGAIIGAFEAWLLIRGMRTLPLRVERMCRNAQQIAEFLESHPNVESVLYPGLESHEGHALAARQMQGGFGSLMSFLVKGDGEDALKVAGKLQLIHRATSLGGVESLIEHRFTIESETGIPPNLLRLSVGIEAVSDLIGDLDQALNS